MSDGAEGVASQRMQQIDDTATPQFLIETATVSMGKWHVWPEWNVWPPVAEKREEKC